jgi:aryl-alcohol dehydrogenase-like predicted oxidoreductase
MERVIRRLFLPYLRNLRHLWMNPESIKMKRRDFLKSSAALAMASQLNLKAKEDLTRRTYRGDVKLSVIGFGGVVVMGHEQPDANRLVAEAFDRGVNYFDVAPSYGNGEAETKLGNALVPYRKNVFLACKTGMRDAQKARAELERSLERLHTDHVDLYQFHAVTTPKDVEQILGPGGAGETFLKARQEGKVRFLGASVHSEDAALALLERFPLDSLLFPLNFVCWQQGKFGPRILEQAKKKGVARMALKSMAYTNWAQGAQRKYPNCWYQPVDDPQLAEKAVRFTLSQDITAAIPPGDDRLFALALAAGSGFKPLSKQETDTLLGGTAGVQPIFPQK